MADAEGTPETNAHTRLSFRANGGVVDIRDIEAEFAATLDEFKTAAGSKLAEKIDAEVRALPAELSDDERKAAELKIRSDYATKLEESFNGGLRSPEKFRSIGANSGTHLLKLLSPRTPASESILRIRTGSGSASLLPSINAKDIPLAKLVFRPIEIHGRPAAKSIVDHIQSPDDLSPVVLAAFAKVFGQSILDGLKNGLAEVSVVETIPGPEFPVIFIPSSWGEVQITPISPASHYMALRAVREGFFAVKEPGRQRGDWLRQELTSKPQNISGAIGGQRVRLHARMPKVLDERSADLHRYRNGGSFPAWRSPYVKPWILTYVKLLEANEQFSNQDTRSGLERTAEALVVAAVDYIKDVFDLAREADGPALEGQSEKSYPIPAVFDVLFRHRFTRNSDEFNRARKALLSPHFVRIERAIVEREFA